MSLGEEFLSVTLVSTRPLPTSLSSSSVGGEFGAGVGITVGEGAEVGGGEGVSVGGGEARPNQRKHGRPWHLPSGGIQAPAASWLGFGLSHPKRPPYPSRKSALKSILPISRDFRVLAYQSSVGLPPWFPHEAADSAVHRGDSGALIEGTPNCGLPASPDHPRGFRPRFYHSFREACALKFDPSKNCIEYVSEPR